MSVILKTEKKNHCRFMNGSAEFLGIKSILVALTEVNLVIAFFFLIYLNFSSPTEWRILYVLDSPHSFLLIHTSFKIASI